MSEEASKRSAESSAGEEDDGAGSSPATHKSSKPLRKPRLVGRSCQDCHRRKVRCDRKLPCHNCVRYGLTCVYPHKNVGASSRVPTLQDISNCQRRLETLVSRFTGDENSNDPAHSDRGANAGAGGYRQDLGLGAFHSETLSQPRHGTSPSAATASRSTSPAGTARLRPSHQPRGISTWEILLNNADIDPLVRQDGSNSADAEASSSLGDDGNGRKAVRNGLAAQPSSDEPLDSAFDPLAFYPDAQLALRLWGVYVLAVDPVMKVLHTPTVQSAVIATILNPRAAQRSTLALTFAIYYAAVTAISHEDTQPADVSFDTPMLLKRYQAALDRFILTPDFMAEPCVTGITALAIYVTCLRTHELGRKVWVLNGLVIRLAQSIGLHRDGASLKLSPFDSEIRLRVWWHLCVLDSRAPEDQGLQPMVDLSNRDLRLPLNVNDDQIYPDMAQLPTPSREWTEMSFFLIQTDSCSIIHPFIGAQQQQESAEALQEIREMRQRISDPVRYLAARFNISMEPGTRTDLQQIAIQHVVTACRKMEFVLQLREEICLRRQSEETNQHQQDVEMSGTSDVLQPSFNLACDNLASSQKLLQENGPASRFKWFFTMYNQWYALAYVLRCLRSKPCGPEADRAWESVEGLFPRATNLRDHEGPPSPKDDEMGHGRIWKFLLLLRRQALLLREYAQQSTSAPANAVVAQTQSISAIGRDFVGNIAPYTADVMSDLGTLPGFSIPEWADQDFMTTCDQGVPESLGLLMPEIPFLPDWNAVINGE